jgi:hypothetical protein
VDHGLKKCCFGGYVEVHGHLWYFVRKLRLTIEKDGCCSRISRGERNRGVFLLSVFNDTQGVSFRCPFDFSRNEVQVVLYCLSYWNFDTGPFFSIQEHIFNIGHYSYFTVLRHRVPGVSTTSHIFSCQLVVQDLPYIKSEVRGE